MEKLKDNPFLYSSIQYGNPLVEEYAKNNATYQYGMDWEEECDHFIHDVKITGLISEFEHIQALRSLGLIKTMNDIPEYVWLVFFYIIPLNIAGVEPFTLLELVKVFQESEVDELEEIGKEKVRSAIEILKKEKVLRNEGNGRYRFTMEAGDFFLGLFLWSAERKGKLNLDN